MPYANPASNSAPLGFHTNHDDDVNDDDKTQKRLAWNIADCHKAKEIQKYKNTMTPNSRDEKYKKYKPELFREEKTRTEQAWNI